MKQYLNIFFILLCLTCGSCKKESVPPTSEKENDPFSRKDDPSNAIVHHIYDLYKTTGVPVFYSDTVQPGTPPVLLNVGYSITGDDNKLAFRYLKNETDVQAGLDFISARLLPKLGNQLKPYSILVADSILLNYYFDPGSGFEYFNYTDVYQGFRTLVIGGIPKLNTMQPAEVAIFCTKIFKAILLSKVRLQPAINDFYQASQNFYGRPVSGFEDNGYFLPYQEKEYYGFLSQGDEGSTYYRNPDKDSDVDQYLTMILSKSDAQIQSEYGSYNLVINKYNILRKIITDLGFKL